MTFARHFSFLAVAVALVTTAACGDRGGNPSPFDGGRSDTGAGTDSGGDVDADWPTDCGGEVTARLTIVGGEPADVCMDPICERWLTIGRADGSGVPLELDCSGVACMGCQPLACPGAACGYTALTSDTLEGRWSGFEVVAGTCDSMDCQGFACAAPGPYVASMCVRRRDPAAAECGFSATPLEQVCTTVEFTWPMTGEISGTIDLGG